MGFPSPAVQFPQELLFAAAQSSLLRRVLPYGLFPENSIPRNFKTGSKTAQAFASNPDPEGVAENSPGLPVAPATLGKQIHALTLTPDCAAARSARRLQGFPKSSIPVRREATAGQDGGQTTDETQRNWKPCPA